VVTDLALKYLHRRRRLAKIIQNNKLDSAERPFPIDSFYSFLNGRFETERFETGRFEIESPVDGRFVGVLIQLC